MRPPSARNRPRRGKIPVVLLGALPTLAGLAALGSVLLMTLDPPKHLSSDPADRPSRATAGTPDPWTGAALRLPLELEDEPSLPAPVSMEHPVAAPVSPEEPRPEPTPSDAPAQAPRSEEAPLRIQALSLERSPEGVETLAIRADASFTPEVFPLEGENPFGSSQRLVVDVKGVASVAETVRGRDVNGEVLRRVRTAFDPEARSFRAVLDLEPDTPYRSDGSSLSDGRFVLRLEKMAGGSEPEPLIQVRAVTVRPADGSGKERLLIQADRFFEPVVFGLDGANPYGEDDRIVVDIPGARPPAWERPLSIRDGRLVRDVRTHYYAASGKLRVVLDLAPAPAYEVGQAFYRKQNLYCLSIIETEKGEPNQSPPPEPGHPKAPARKPEPPVVPPDLLAMDSAAREKPGLLRSTAADLDEEQVRAMFREHGFYSTCGIYNAKYCNQDSEFANRLRECGQGVICDDATGLMWERAGSDQPMGWVGAAGYIRERNRSRAWGHDDWRLPTLEELLSLMEGSWADGGLYLSDLFDADPRSCWSGDKRGDARAWKVNYHLGYALDALVEERNWVRAVRRLDSPSNWAWEEEPFEDPKAAPGMGRQALRK